MDFPLSKVLYDIYSFHPILGIIIISAKLFCRCTYHQFDAKWDRLNGKTVVDHEETIRVIKSLDEYAGYVYFFTISQVLGRQDALASYYDGI